METILLVNNNDIFRHRTAIYLIPEVCPRFCSQKLKYRLSNHSPITFVENEDMDIISCYILVAIFTEETQHVCNQDEDNSEATRLRTCYTNKLSQILVTKHSHILIFFYRHTFDYCNFSQFFYYTYVHRYFS